MEPSPCFDGEAGLLILRRRVRHLSPDVNRPDLPSAYGSECVGEYLSLGTETDSAAARARALGANDSLLGPSGAPAPRRPCGGALARAGCCLPRSCVAPAGAAPVVAVCSAAARLAWPPSPALLLPALGPPVLRPCSPPFVPPRSASCPASSRLGSVSPPLPPPPSSPRSRPLPSPRRLLPPGAFGL